MSTDPENLGRFFKTQNWRFGKCLEPTMKCNESAIRAHSIQNSRIIDLLEERNHVVMLRPQYTKRGPKIEFKLIGRNEASTFTGLCSKHDSSLFAPIDTKELDVTDHEQLFLLAYRSVTRELHAVMEGAAKIQSAYLSRVERGIDPKDEPSPAGLLATQQLINAYETYRYREENYDHAFLSRQCGTLKHDILPISPQLPCIAVSALFSLDDVWNGDDIVRVALNVFPIDREMTLAIFSYSNRDERLARANLDRVISGKGDLQRYELSKLILSSVENFLISPRQYQKWSAAKAARIRETFASTIFDNANLKDHPDLMLF
jgi:hypothetical protein